MTNREKLSQLSDDELIAKIEPVSCPPIWIGTKKGFRCEDGRYNEDNGGCNACWRDWLGEEIEEVGNEENR